MRVLLAALMLIAPAASAQVLSLAGADLGRMARPQDAVLAVAVEDIGIAEGFLVARFQTNQPLMKSRDGPWIAWDGDPATLAPMDVTGGSGVLRFAIGAWPTPDVLAPCTFTLGYWTADGMKFGHVTVEGL